MNCTPSPTRSPADQLFDLLDVEQLDTDLYRGRRAPWGVGRVFGGQAVAQALMAAIKSTDPQRNAHSLHAYFMRPGDDAIPILLQVRRDFDGGSFSTRRVIATQRGVPILNLSASFQRKEEGLHHWTEMPQVPGPDSLLSQYDHVQRYSDKLPPFALEILTRPSAIEMRPVGLPSFMLNEKVEPTSHCWFRCPVPQSVDLAMRQTILAYMTDMVLLNASFLPHGINWATHRFQTASIDHALWLHSDPPLEGWLLYSTESPWTGQSRGFNRGQIFSEDGRLVASVAQEGLIRLRGPLDP